MNNKKIIILVILTIIIILIISIMVTSAFMKPIDNGENLTSLSLSSCAKIKLAETSSIDISNSYPISRNKGLQTTPYSFTVTSYCDSYVGFNMYIAILEDSAIDLKKIHYILTNKESKTALQEGLLSDLEEDTSFSESEKVELRTSIKGNFSKIYKLFTGKIPLKGNREYDLYLFIDENATNEIMGKTFKGGVAIKSYDREVGVSVDEVCAEGDNLNNCVTRLSDLFGSDETLIYHHNGTLENGIDDGSYRYAGASENVNNFVCFGSDEKECPNNNLYRIIGVIDGKVKLIKYDYATKEDLGTNGAYVEDEEIDKTVYAYYRGNLTTTSRYIWQIAMPLDFTNNELNKINLNTNFLNSFSQNWQNKIALYNWKVPQISNDLANAIAKTAYQYEILNLDETVEVKQKIGLMYTYDYGFGVLPKYWTKILNYYGAVGKYNWIPTGLDEFLITSVKGGAVAIALYSGFSVANVNSYNKYSVRPVFFLINEILYKKGNGTKENPIRIN